MLRARALGRCSASAPTSRRCRLPTASLDVVVSGLALMDVPDLGRAAAANGRACCSHGGVVLCSTLHPRGRALGWTRTFETPRRARATAGVLALARRTFDRPARTRRCEIDASAEPGARVASPGEPVALVVRARRRELTWPCGAALRSRSSIRRVVGADGRLSDSLTVERPTASTRLAGRRSGAMRSIDLDGAIVYPGLVNAHDHLELNSFPRLKWRTSTPTCASGSPTSSRASRRDPRLAAARPDTLAYRVWVGGLKNLLSGVTTVCHHNPLHRPLSRRFPGSRRPALRLEPLAADRRRLRRGGLSRDAAGVAVDHPRGGGGRRRGARRDRRRSGAWAASGRTPSWSTASRSTMSVRPLVLAARRRSGVVSDVQPLSVRPHGGRRAVRSCGAARHRQRLAAERRRRPARRAARGTRARGRSSAESLYRAVTSSAARMLRQRDAGALTPGAPADLTIVQRLARRSVRVAGQARDARMCA